MLDSNIRGLFKRVEYQIANLKGLFSKNEKQMLDNVNEFKKDNEEFKDNQKFELASHINDDQNPHKVTKAQVGLDKVDNVKQASSEEFNIHINNKNNPHGTTKDQVGLDNVENVLQASKEEFDIHLEDKSNPHSVTKLQIGLDNVDNIKQAAKTDFDNHIKDKMLHVSESEKSKWDNAQLYKLTQDSGERKSLPLVVNGNDVLSLPPGSYYSTGQYLSNMPNPSDLSWFNIDVGQAETRKDIHLIRSTDNTHWFGTVHTDSVFKGWERLLAEKDLKSSWIEVTLVTGTTKHFAGNPLTFSIRQNSLHLRGSFEGIPANDTVIARFAQKPSGTTVFGGATVGTFGTARMSLGVDGSLKFDGLDTNDNSKVTRVEINELIPLW